MFSTGWISESTLKLFHDCLSRQFFAAANVTAEYIYKMNELLLLFFCAIKIASFYHLIYRLFRCFGHRNSVSWYTFLI